MDFVSLQPSDEELDAFAGIDPGSIKIGHSGGTGGISTNGGPNPTTTKNRRNRRNVRPSWRAWNSCNKLKARKALYKKVLAGETPVSSIAGLKPSAGKYPESSGVVFT